MGQKLTAKQRAAKVEAAQQRELQEQKRREAAQRTKKIFTVVVWTCDSSSICKLLIETTFKEPSISWPFFLLLYTQCSTCCTIPATAIS